MTLKVGINGFGRIGRMVLRSIIENSRKDLEIVAINNRANAEMSSFLLKHDTVHGKLKAKISHSEKSIEINGKKINMIHETEISKIDWKKYKVDIVMECTGKFNSKEKSAEHIKSGARKVLVSAPSKNAINIIYGVSEITRQNSKIFLNELKKNNLNKVLIIGGASQGSGTELLMNSDNISITSVDKMATENVNYIADAHYLPFKDETFDGVWIQAVLEHVISPSKVIDEIYRVLKKNGFVYAETPFIQQIHMGKDDYTRYTVSGHRYLFNKFEHIKYGVNGGPAIALAWAIKYFFWSIFNEKISVYVSLIPFLILRFIDKLISEKNSWDGASGVYFFGKKNVNYKFEKNELNNLYKGRQT